MLPPCLEYLLEKQVVVKPLQQGGTRITMTGQGGMNSSTKTTNGGITSRVGNRGGQGSYTSRTQTINPGAAPSTQTRTRHYTRDTDNPSRVYQNSGGTTIRRDLQHMPRGGNMGGGSGGRKMSRSRSINSVFNFFSRNVPRSINQGFHDWLDR